MKQRMVNIMAFTCLSILLFGCEDEEKRIDVTFELSNDITEKVVQVAKDYVIKNNCGTIETVQVGSANITDHLVDASDEISNQKDIGQIVYRVTFKDNPNVVTGLPEVLINKDNNRVVGFIAGE
ncbi:hypothetical protein JFL43_17010 [Viridibacillus sp. YIM B01967]|uniref:Lipoprotein n=1 Tax=Viridibacillus soli TaxID=2798301 RepID=A0ABS1HAU4_9BACL|nr:hypothetical protein [Viridibacillus soli]MBK3496526.1 hypothetical protein [Viridibacillus soli]